MLINRHNFTESEATAVINLQAGSSAAQLEVAVPAIAGGAGAGAGCPRCPPTPHPTPQLSTAEEARRLVPTLDVRP